MRHIIDEAKSHLGAAIMQSVDSDDRIIMDHVRAAHVLLGVVRPDATNVDLRDALKAAVGELENLLAMVEGEVPSLLEDHAAFVTITAAIENGNAALAASR